MCHGEVMGNLVSHVTAATQVTAKAGIGMIGALARKFFGSANDRRGKGYQCRANAVHARERGVGALSDEALKARTAEFRQQLADGKTLNDILVPAFATVREAAKRTLGQRAFDVP